MAELLPTARSTTRVVSLGSPPDQVFDWLVQMGFGRAGWYSYDWIDNLGRPSATGINPDWAVSEVGDLMPGGPVDFVVYRLERPEHLVFGLLDQPLSFWRIGFTLGYRLEPVGDRSTRLTVHARAAIDGPAGQILARLLLMGDGVMVRRQLRGLRRRCRPMRV